MCEAGFHLVISGRAEMGPATASLALRAMWTQTLSRMSWEGIAQVRKSTYIRCRELRSEVLVE